MNDPSSTDLILALNGDTVAENSDGYVHFGSDIPVSVVGTPISLVGLSVDAC